MKLTRRKTIALAMLVVAGALAVWVFVPMGPSIADASRIKLGMNKTEVMAILNSPGVPLTPSFERWDVSNGYVDVSYRWQLGQCVVQDVTTYHCPVWKKKWFIIKGKMGW